MDDQAKIVAQQLYDSDGSDWTDIVASVRQLSKAALPKVWDHLLEEAHKEPTPEHYTREQWFQKQLVQYKKLFELVCDDIKPAPPQIVAGGGAAPTREEPSRVSRVDIEALLQRITELQTRNDEQMRELLNELNAQSDKAQQAFMHIEQSNIEALKAVSEKLDVGVTGEAFQGLVSQVSAIGAQYSGFVEAVNDAVQTVVRQELTSITSDLTTKYEQLATLQAQQQQAHEQKWEQLRVDLVDLIKTQMLQHNEQWGEWQKTLQDDLNGARSGESDRLEALRNDIIDAVGRMINEHNEKLLLDFENRIQEHKTHAVESQVLPQQIEQINSKFENFQQVAKNEGNNWIAVLPNDLNNYNIDNVKKEIGTTFKNNVNFDETKINNNILYIPATWLNSLFAREKDSMKVSRGSFNDSTLLNKAWALREAVESKRYIPIKLLYYLSHLTIQKKFTGTNPNPNLSQISYSEYDKPTWTVDMDVHTAMVPFTTSSELNTSESSDASWFDTFKL